jgi:hypothetical protein
MPPQGLERPEVQADRKVSVRLTYDDGDVKRS